MFIAKKQNKCHMQIGRPIGGPSVPGLTLDVPEAVKKDSPGHETGIEDFFLLIKNWIKDNQCSKKEIQNGDIINLHRYFNEKIINTEKYVELGRGNFGSVVIDNKQNDTVLKNILNEKEKKFLRSQKPGDISQKDCLVLNEIKINIKTNKYSHFVRFLGWSYSREILNANRDYISHFQLRFNKCDGSLGSFLKENKSVDLKKRTVYSRIVTSQIPYITGDITEALKILHDELNIRHFDIKPDNVLFKDIVIGKRTKQWLLADFGCSSINEPNCSTLMYQPTFLGGDSSVIPAKQYVVTDLYAFGLLLSNIVLPDKFGKIKERSNKSEFVFNLEIKDEIGPIKNSTELKEFIYILLARNINDGGITITTYGKYIDNIILFFKEKNIEFSPTMSLTAMVHKYLHNYKYSDTFDIMSRLKKKLSSRTLKLLGKRGIE